MTVRAPSPAAPRRRALAAACLAHLLHDGYMDLVYVLLPLWQAEFGLGYASLGLVRAVLPGAMAAAQVPVDRMTSRYGARRSLAVGTLVAAAGFVALGASGGLATLCLALAVAGLGSSTQHPRASVVVSEAYGGESRGPLGLYNFAGDLGKAMFPALTSLLLLLASWRAAAFGLAAIGAAVAAVLVALVPETRASPPAAATASGRTRRDRRDFALLLAIGTLDTATRMGFLLFLPFVLVERHASEGLVGTGLALVFAGGAFGKAVCGWLGARVGLVGTVVVSETLTALMIAAVPAMPLGPLLVLLPALGVVLNGTSSVLYGTVPEVAPGDVGQAFAVFYMGVIGAAAVAPVVFGALADVIGRHAAILATTGAALATLPLVVILSRRSAV